MKWALFPLFVVICVMVASSASQARTIKDTTGFTSELPELGKGPNRIITLAPSLGELAADLLGDHVERIIGVSEYTDYPPVLKKVPSVGSYAKVNLEKILSLKPDLILATSDGNSKDQVAHLRELHLAVVVVSGESLEKVEESIQLVSQAVGYPHEGERELAQFKKGIENFKVRAKAHAKLKVMLQLGDQPMVVVGQGSFLSEALGLLGAQNSYSDSLQHYPKPSIEDVVQKNPDMILILALDQNLTPFQEMASRWSRFPEMKAVQSKRVKVLFADTLLRPSLRLLEGLSLLENALYGKS